MATWCGRTKKRNTQKKILENTILINRYRFKPQEITIYKQKFERMSTGSGFSKEDFRKNMTMLGVKAIRSVADRIFDVMNKSRSQTVSLEEYLSYIDILVYGNSEEKAQQNFSIIAGPSEATITFKSFTQWLISVWKMLHNLTGEEISVNQEQIKGYFDQLDLKADGVIDFDEYFMAISQNSNLLEWFDMLNQGITERLNVSNVEEFKKDDTNYTKKLAVIEADIKLLIEGMLEPQSAHLGLPVSSRDIRISLSKTDRRMSSVLVDPNLEEMRRTGNKHLTLSAFRGFNPGFDPKQEIVKEKLVKLLEKLESLKEKGVLDEEEEGEGEADGNFRRTWTMSIPRQKPEVVKKNDVIYWGDEDWNLVLNMMLGIQKSVKATVAGMDIATEVTPNMFLEKVKHKLLPSQSKGTKTFKFRDFAPTIFERIRRLYGIKSTDYIRSLGMEKMMHALMATEFSSLMGQCTTGKSGSFFYYSDDGKYMLKTLSEDEYEFFRKFIPDYYFHIYKNPHTLLTRFFGFHKIIVCSSNKKLYFVVMGNLFKNDYELDIKYDLKGSTLGRITSKDQDKTIARKDNNFNEENRKIRIGRKRKNLLMEQIEKDAEVLRRADVIDYSLLLGISTVNRRKVPKKNVLGPFAEIDDGGMVSDDGNELYFLGIIDILTHYGTKKKLEHFFKNTIHKKAAVSCAPPEYYAQRFLNYMETVIQ